MKLPFSLSIDRKQPLARLLCRGDIAALTLRADGLMEFERRDGTCHAATVESGTTVYPRLVILRLRLRVGGRVESLVLPRAATGVEGHRRLRVWLKWRASVAA